MQIRFDDYDRFQTFIEHLGRKIRSFNLTLLV